MARIPASPGLRIGRPPSTPKTPMLVIVKLPRARSLRRGLPGTGQGDQGAERLSQLQQRQPVGVLDVGHDQAPRSRGGDAQVDAALQHDLLGLPRPRTSSAPGLRFSAISTALATISSGEILTSAKSRRARIVLHQLHRRGDVGIDPDGHVRSGERRLHHRRRGGLAHALDRDAAVRCRRPPDLGRLESRRAGAAARCGGRLHVGTGDHPAGAGAGQGRRGRRRDRGRACVRAVWPAPHRSTAVPSRTRPDPGAGSGLPCGFGRRGLQRLAMVGAPRHRCRRSRRCCSPARAPRPERPRWPPPCADGGGCRSAWRRSRPGWRPARRSPRPPRAGAPRSARPRHPLPSSMAMIGTPTSTVSPSETSSPVTVPW